MKGGHVRACWVGLPVPWGELAQGWLPNSWCPSASQGRDLTKSPALVAQRPVQLSDPILRVLVTPGILKSNHYLVGHGLAQLGVIRSERAA